jgi:Holliday junction resolvasome RuvABC endonuclease subunit
MKVIGLDLSINSTGVCINNNGKYKYYIICSKMTKKMKEFDNKYIKLIEYNKQSVEGEYSEKELIKTNNIYNIIGELKSIIKKEKPDECRIEGISYGSVGSAALVDLSGLNFMVRQMLIDLKIPFKIISPTSNKKFAVGNGQADKDIIIDSWLRLQPHLKGIDIKVDDIADAYFLSNYIE